MFDRTAQASSPRASSSSSARQPPPSYLSSRSADVILSEVRPTRIKSEALRSVNVLLDELLWLILGSARSFATDRLRSGLLKVLPTTLGKDALLEAEVELRAYVERNPPATPVPTDEPTIQKFPLQPAFELLRTKCEAYSSLGDQDENTETETALYSRMAQIAGDAAPKASAIAPAALYLTAVLEHICEHVLSNVGRVVARDSSRTTAHAQDLYVALCEDETIYSLFKTMKVHDQIEYQSKMTRPRRSKSFSRNDLGNETSQHAPLSDPPAIPKSRQSLDSTVSNGSNTNLANRPSVDKARNKGLFKNSSSRSLAAESGNSNIGDSTRHRRSNSLLGDKKNSLILSENGPKIEAPTEVSPNTDDDGSMQDFDDLMRSGNTMKVSLTPDRLKTFEVFAKEKNQRANRPGHLPPSGRDASAPPSSFPNGATHLAHKASQPSKSRNHVESIESIAETPEDPVRPRAASITSPPSSKEDKSPTSTRLRSLTDSQPRATHTTLSSNDTSRLDSGMPVAAVDPVTGMPKRTRRGPARNPESLDLDDLMDVSEDDIPTPKKTMLTPKSAQATQNQTRDLMEFLSQGPPEPPAAPLSPGPSVSESQRAKHGRFRTIVSKLTGSSSNERLSVRPGEESMDTLRRASTGVTGAPVPQRPQPGSLHYKRSTPNVASAARSMATSSLPSSQETSIPAPEQRSRQLSLTRKAVPQWEAPGGVHRERNELSVPAKPSPRQSDVTNSSKPLPKPFISPAAEAASVDPTVGVSPTRKRPPRESERIKETSNAAVVNGKSPSPGPPPPISVSTNGHANAEQDSVKSPVRSPQSDRRALPPGLTVSIPSDEHVRDLRRMIARATNVDECRVLVDIFLARCGAPPGDSSQQASEPITPPVSPVRTENANYHESNLIEVLLGDGPASPTHLPIVVPDLTVSASSSTPNTLPRSSDLSERDSPHPRTSPVASPILTPAPSPVMTTA